MRNIWGENRIITELVKKNLKKKIIVLSTLSIIETKKKGKHISIVFNFKLKLIPLTQYEIV